MCTHMEEAIYLLRKRTQLESVVHAAYGVEAVSNNSSLVPKVPWERGYCCY